MKKSRRRINKIVHRTVKRAKRAALHGVPRWRQLLKAQNQVEASHD
ncbi:hypothetical protein [Lacticaseibacillus rhamnosus]|nr:hypothetical protein [Lacticaseibacillus rhamnosus]MDE3294263.1 hypothetical protein [Lacticaseibacillus rhamnosus]